MKLVRSVGVVSALAIAVLGMFAGSVCANEIRTTLNLETGWRFKQADGMSGVESPSFDDRGWSTINLPHTWNRIGNYGAVRAPTSNNVQGVGWYRQYF